jgi:uncharacterized protein
LTRDGDRDRDLAGRPRNARPRDALGRPLDRDGGPGSGPGSGSGSGSGPAEERIPDDLAIGGADAAALADRLLRDGRPFHAHEVLEAAWKSGPAEERDLWQGLAQIAVGLTHARRGNARGAVALLRRGVARVREHQDRDEAGPDGSGSGAGLDASSADGGSYPYGMDVAGVVAAVDTLAARIEQDGLEGIPSAGLSPGLLAGSGSDRPAERPTGHCGTEVGLG